MQAIGIIPARYASSRLPGKPLADICGKTMIQRVYEQASLADKLDKVIVATDDERVYAAVKAFGGNVVMTSPEHNSGTDRLAEVAKDLQADLIINIQGDEPLVPPEILNKLVEAFIAEKELKMATLKCVMPQADYDNPAAVKVVTDKNDYALYFSRSLLPYIRNEQPELKIYKHIGVYSYTKDFLLSFAAMPQSMLEKTESLEQLRVLENGYKIKVLAVDYDGVGVDTPEDLEKVRRIIAATI